MNLRRGIGVGVLVAAIMIGLVLMARTQPPTGITSSGEPSGRHTATSAPSSTVAGASPTAAVSGKPVDPQNLVKLERPTDVPKAELLTFYAQKANWQDCPQFAARDCAKIRVPIDYTNPTGETVEIAMQRRPANKPAERKGSLFINPGGPGGSGIQFLAEVDLFMGSDVLDVWDIVGWDPRGLGESGGFECLTDAELDAEYAADPTPETAAEKAALTSGPKTHFAKCLQRGGLLAKHMGTDEVIRDLDIMRNAVLDEHLNYYGVSYGTFIGQMYADEFTSRVGYMVLDSNVAPDALGYDVPQTELNASWLDYEEQLKGQLTVFVQSCQTEPECPLTGDPDAAIKQLTTFLDTLDSKPLRSDDPSLPTVTEGWATEAIVQGMRERESHPYLAQALNEAMKKRDGTLLADFVSIALGRDEDGVYPTASYERSSLPINCADWPVADWEKISPDAATLAKTPLANRLDRWTPSLCLGFTGPVRQNIVVGSTMTHPVIVIGNRNDPVTSFDQTEEVARTIIRSRLVTVDNETHGVWGAGNTCADKIISSYFAKGVAPAPDTSCPVE